MSNVKRASVMRSNSRTKVLSTLKAAQLVEQSKAVLPAEIMSTILEYLPVPDLLRFARTSKRMQEMVYDDTRWVRRLQSMSCWNEGEARKRFEETMRKRWESQKARHDGEAKRTETGVEGQAGQRNSSVTLFDAGVEQQRQQQQQQQQRQQPPEEKGFRQRQSSIVNGFETLSLSSNENTTPYNDSVGANPIQDADSLLKIFSTIQSVRGAARQEYGRLYAAIAPFYFDLARSKSHTDPAIFRVYRDPEQQATMLANIKRFSASDWAQGWRERQSRLSTMIGIFEGAVLREFERGLEIHDYSVTANRYAHVLEILNGAHAGVEVFVQQNPLFNDRDQWGHSMDCINEASQGSVVLEPAQRFFRELAESINEQTRIIDQVFSPELKVLDDLLDKVADEIIMEYITPLFDEAHQISIPAYLDAVSGVFKESLQFAGSLVPAKANGTTFREKLIEVLIKIFDPHVDLYLQDELEQFKRRAESEVGSWEKKLTEQDETRESYFMSNVNRQADKKDFLSSFKKVVMMPVNAFPITTSKPSQAPTPKPPISRPETPGLGFGGGTSTLEAPTDELSAKAALMASKMEGIRSLFSLEVALDLVHAAKAGLERVSQFVVLGGQTGEEAKEQCSAIFVALLQILGSRHVQPGFDKAIDHLGKYKPREVSEHNQNVAPLVTFLELVNVGDLISQMIDVFYEQQLVAQRLADRNDFLDQAGKAKKKFEQMLDERVAAGLNKGIDVLMDEVEYICGTQQQPSDFNPPPEAPFDVGTSKAAEQVVALVSSHISMLNGSTDKKMLDVFNQEVGLRLFHSLCKHLKRQRISTVGAVKLISDMNLYYEYIKNLKNLELLQYFKALRELSQIYLIDQKHAKEMAAIIADGERFNGILHPEELYEFAERREDWFLVKKDVEKAMYGIGCMLM